MVAAAADYVSLYWKQQQQTQNYLPLHRFSFALSFHSRLISVHDYDTDIRFKLNAYLLKLVS